MEQHGLLATGVSPNGRLVEVVELVDHPWFIGCQFHPEFQSKPEKAHPLFKQFVKAALGHRTAGENAKVLSHAH